MLCVISGGNWNNGSNAGVWALNLNNVRGNSNNNVGFRTWASARFVRGHVIKSVRADAKRDRIEPIISRLGHAKRTCSLKPLLDFLKEKHHDLFSRLPQTYRRYHHPHTAPA